MEVVLVIIGILMLAGLGLIAFTLLHTRKPEEQSLMLEYLEALRKEVRESSTHQRQENQTRLDRIDERLTRGLEVSQNTLQKQFAQSAEVIKQVTEKLTHLDETNKQVLNFSEKMQSLENILKNPKQRGILGEYFLETLLGHVLQPNQYKMQYSFSNGEIVDAAIFFRDKIIPVDAKFSLEKYNRIMEEQDGIRRDQLEKEFKMDIKNRIDETAKYIRPHENTTEFAFMFIPAEGIYYNLLIYKVGSVEINANDLVEYAFKKHVILVSPTSFFAYLQTVLQGLKALEMEASVKDIVKWVEELGRHLITYEMYLKKMGTHLGTTVNMYNSAYKEFHKIDKDVHKITDGVEGGKVEKLFVETPQLETLN